MNRTALLVVILLGLVALTCSQAFGGYVDAVLADSPVAYWRLSETAGTTTANSANTPPSTNPPSLLDGTVSGGVDPNVAGPRPAPFPGFSSSNSAGDFDGLGGHIAVTDPGTGSVLDFGSGDSITMEAWVSPTASPSLDYVVGKGRVASTSSTNQNYAVRLRSASGGSAALSFIYRNAANNEWNVWNSTADFAVDGDWHHVALTYTWDGTGTSVRAYIDGAPSGGSWHSAGGYGSGTSDPYQDNDELWIGSAQAGSPGSSVEGGIDEVAVYREALSDSQIRRHHMSGISGTFFNKVTDPNPGGLGDNLLGYWRLGESSPSASARDEVDTGAPDAYGDHPATYHSFATSDMGRQGGFYDDGNPAANFDAASRQYLTMDGGLVDGRTALTAVMLVRVDDLTKDNTLLGKGIFSSGQPILFWRDEENTWGPNPGARDTLTIMICDANTEMRAVAPDGTFNDDCWHLVGFTFEGSEADGLKLYFDGKLVATASTLNVDSIKTTASDLSVGLPVGSLTTDKAFDGLIDEVLLFDRALGEQEMWDLFADGNIIPEPCTLALLGLGGLSLLIRRRRTK